MRKPAMYLPALTAETDPETLHALIAAHPLGTWVTQGEGGLTADHVPFLVDRDAGEHGTLVGHVARANPVWQTLLDSPAAESLIVFQGAQSYISPSWYAAKKEHGKVVPTWNYAVVHAHGVARAIEDRAWLRRLVGRLTDTQEATLRQTAPWQVTDAPADYIDGMLNAIVGIEVSITRLVGKWKVSRNRPAADRQGVVSGLSAEGWESAASMAALVQRTLEEKVGR